MVSGYEGTVSAGLPDLPGETTIAPFTARHPGVHSRRSGAWQNVPQ